MNKQYELRIDILNMLLRTMVSFTILSMLLLFVTNNTDYIWRSLILLPAAVISYIIGKCTRHIWTYILLQLLLLALYLFLQDNLILRIAYETYILIYAIFQFAIDLKKKVGNTTLFFAAIFLAMYCVCKYTYPGNTALGRFFFYLAVAYGIIYILNMYFINLYIYLQKHRDKSNLPLKQIRSSNRIYILVFVYLSFISMLAFTKFPMDKLLHFLGRCLIRFLRFIFSGLTKKSYEEDVPQEDMPELEMPPDYSPEPTPAGHPSLFWQHLYQLLIAFLMAAGVCIILMLLVYGLYHIYKLYYQKKVFKAGEEKVEIISPFEKSGLSAFGDIRPSRKRFLDLFSKSNNDKIRKLYLRAVQKHTEPDRELKYDAPAELSKLAVTPDDKLTKELRREKEEVLTALYEKARYSREECSKEEAQAVKNLLK